LGDEFGGFLGMCRVIAIFAHPSCYPSSRSLALSGCSRGDFPPLASHASTRATAIS